MAWDDISESVCPIARSLAVLGDRWTLLIIRELFLGTRRFDAFQAQTGASPHLLSNRLKRLESDGVIERRLYQQHPPRYDYRLTAKGRDLHAIVLALRSWGLRWGNLDPAGEPAVRLVHRECGGEVDAAPVCIRCGAAVPPRDVAAVFGYDFAAERDARVASFNARKPQR
ncbi:MAG: helix-turn-helix transcriptional regulator [Rhodospirillales bacterium]|nr:helix-turn-helix transcriptional regulator [Rhodospirillales bacterium]